jgi:hypothetical protein
VLEVTAPRVSRPNSSLLLLPLLLGLSLPELDVLRSLLFLPACPSLVFVPFSFPSAELLDLFAFPGGEGLNFVFPRSFLPFSPPVFTVLSRVSSFVSFGGTRPLTVSLLFADVADFLLRLGSSAVLLRGIREL